MYPPRKVNKKPVILITSSYFDSIMESLIKKFQDFVNDPEISIKEPKTKFLSLLQNYAMNFNVTPLYNGRVNLISKVCNLDDVKFT
ncbi:hypothetical protein TSAR_005334 [Trichomalopsis sarcophagae]|uniref:Uncharacterized protein n=1 Tax=Trichomalopsis sarcophagae TaxID=543379 RepID=A0A232ELJ8_9HYME|nr:hypothetical protein TSAR_005334 [Trichomalopsis sarcophagae]